MPDFRPIFQTMAQTAPSDQRSSLRVRVKSKPDPLETLFTFEENLHACMTMELKELEDRVSDHPSLESTWTVLKAFLRRPGKRVRPSLFLLSYSLFDGRKTPPPAAAFRVACALEIFHAFALIHDDLIDCSDSRRGKPTLHRALQGAVAQREGNAKSLALVLGDILFGFAMECFVDPQLPPAHTQGALRYFLRIAQETGLGQASEIAHLETPLSEVSESEILKTYDLKTTRYTIECPLVLGSMLAGGHADKQASLRAFARPLGLAFQIENDLHEVELLPDIAPDLAYDFHCGVKTLVLKRLYDALTPRKQRILINALADAPSPEALNILARLVAESGIVDELNREVRAHFAEARQLLQESSLSAGEAAFMESVVTFIQSKRRHSESSAPSEAKTA